MAAWVVQIASSTRWIVSLWQRIAVQQTASPRMTVNPRTPVQKGWFTQIAQYQYYNVSAIVASVLAVKGWYRIFCFADSAGTYYEGYIRRSQEFNEIKVATNTWSGYIGFMHNHIGSTVKKKYLASINFITDLSEELIELTNLSTQVNSFGIWIKFSLLIIIQAKSTLL